MTHLKKSPALPVGRFILLMLLTVIIGSRTFAQDYLSSLNLINKTKYLDHAKEVIQDNEYTSTGNEKGNFYSNPLMLNGKPIDYNVFNIKSEGELTVIKGAAVTGKTIQVPYYVYLRRNGNKVLIPGKEGLALKQNKIDLSEILHHAKPGDHLVIEAVHKEDGHVKRILKIVGGC